MPEIPEYYKRARLSQTGPIGRAPDASAAHRATGEAGAVMTQFGLAVLDKFLKGEAVDQFNNFKAETIAQVDDYERTLDPTQDTKNWEKGLDELMMKRRNAALPALSNPQARQNAGSWLTGQEGVWKSKVFWSAKDAKTDQMRASAESNINLHVQRAIEAVDDKTLAESKESLFNEIDSRTTREGYIGIFSAPDAKLLKEKYSDEIDTKRPIFLHKTQLDAGLLEAGIHPEAVIEEMDKAISSGKALPDKPDLKSEDWRVIKQRAEATLVERNATATAEYKAAVNKGEQAIQEKLYLKKDFTDIFKYIDEKLPLEAVTEREHWYDKAIAMTKASVSEEDNPFEKTMNPTRLADVLWQAANDNISHAEIAKGIGDKDGYSISDGLLAHRTLDDDAFAFKNQRIIAWAGKLGQDFGGPKQDRVLYAQHADKLRKFVLDYERRNTKLPSDQEIGEFYDQNFVTPGVTAWLGRAAKGVGRFGWRLGTYSNPLSPPTFPDFMKYWTGELEEPAEQPEGKPQIAADILSESRKPGPLAEFKLTVKDLYKVDPQKAEQYYEKWKHLYKK